MNKFVCVATSLFVLMAVRADAGGCHAVQCQQQFIATAVAVPVAVPVANYQPYSYEYTPQQAPTVNVNINTDAIAAAVVAKLNGPTNDVPPIPQPPGPLRAEAPAAVSTNIAQRCLKCHQTADPAKGKPSLAGPLDCPTRLAAIRAVVSGKMPKVGAALSADAVGKLIEELSAE